MMPLLVLALAAPDLDLTRAVVVAPPDLAGPAAEAVRMLREEVAARSFARWEPSAAWPPTGPTVVVGPEPWVRQQLANEVFLLPPPADEPEGYQIGQAGQTVWVAGNDARGVLFGVGRLLRELRIGRDKVTLPAGFFEKSVPTTPLRGHQIGYRPKTNSYDGWTLAMWEQYLRDLIVFGCNAVELIPPRSDDAADSPLFPAPPLRMVADVSRLAAKYGLDVWLWYPAMDKDYADPKTVEFALKEWGEVFAAVPKLDAVFVPGGDPGHTPPKHLFALLEKQAANLRKHHPKAELWVSPQSFTGPWMDDFLALMKPKPDWLAGIVYGPQTRLSLAKLRAALPGVRIRDYPDITHSRTCQYPARDWDAAFALTEGREIANPRPTETAHHFRHGRRHTFGFITYSEGCHDDVNKVVWSAMGWDEKADIQQVLTQYGRYFVAPELADRFAEGLLLLERNWRGAVAANHCIDDALALFQKLEKEGGPRAKLSWRFQQAMYRAVYDTHIRARLLHETACMDAAFARLKAGDADGAAAALDRGTVHPAPELRTRLGELAEALFQSIRAQLSVTKYHGQPGRGTTLDSADAPLTDAAWLRAEVKAGGGAAALTRTDPGPGGFYDDFGDPRNQPHLDRGPGWEADPAYDESPQCAFSLKGGAVPRAWWHYAETHYDTPLTATYPGLDPKASYRVRVVYGNCDKRPVRLTAGGHEVHGWLHKPFEPVEFAVPPEATRTGKLTLTWTPQPGAGGPGRGCQVCEVWLLKAATDGVHDASYPSKLLGRDVPIKVYLPPGYAAGTERYPVVYNLHGGGGSPQRQWDRTRKTLAAVMAAGARPVIYVYVNGLGNTEFVNTAGGQPIERSIVEELVPWVDATYCTIPERRGRAVDGFSMGGFGCLSVAFRHPDLFCAVVSYGAALTISATGKNYQSPEHFAEHDPHAVARAKADAVRAGVRVRMVCGDADYLYPSNVAFKDQLEGLKIPVDWVPVAGVAHNTQGLYEAVGRDSLRFLAESFALAEQGKRMDVRATPRAATTDNPLSPFRPAGSLPRLTLGSHPTAGGRPFFWLADAHTPPPTAMDPEALDKYLEDRASKGFSVVVSPAGAGLDRVADAAAAKGLYLAAVGGACDRPNFLPLATLTGRGEPYPAAFAGSGYTHTSGGDRWEDKLDALPAGQLRHLRALVESRPMAGREPDDGTLTADPVAAVRGDDRTWAMFLVPVGKSVTVQLPNLTGPHVVGWWFDPADGSTTDKPFGRFPVTDKKRTFPPTAGGDRVLVLDCEAKNYPPPGGHPVRSPKR